MLFATQCKNDNAAFYWSSAVSGSLALLLIRWRLDDILEGGNTVPHENVYSKSNPTKKR